MDTRSHPASVKVWDPLVRIFHWSLAAGFLLAYVTGEEYGSLHETLGYSVLGLVAFRFVWGIAGPEYARFTSFVPSPSRLFGYLKSMVAGKETRYLGHNPAGGTMVAALLLFIALTGASGWLMTTGLGYGEWMEEVHEFFAGTTLALVGLHVAGVLFTSLRHHENLVAAMITGRKRP